jgi:hypothetical protein
MAAISALEGFKKLMEPGPRTQFRIVTVANNDKRQRDQAIEHLVGTKADRSRPLSDLNAPLADRVKIDRYLVSRLSEWHFR